MNPLTCANSEALQSPGFSIMIENSTESHFLDKMKTPTCLG